MKEIDIARLNFFEATYDTDSLPPPYSYRYKITGTIDQEEFAVNFNLAYTGREALTEEEILEEGFTLNDDRSFQVKLPKVWIGEIKTNLRKANWINPRLQSSREDGSMIIKVADIKESKYEGMPDNSATWEYFLQEMIQAIYEVSGNEMPLQIRYLEIEEGKDPVQIMLQPTFSNRELMVSSNRPPGNMKTAERPWAELKKILKSVYIPYYEPDKTEAETPTQPGKYIDIGERNWYKFGEGATDPDKSNKALERLEQQLKDLL